MAKEVIEIIFERYNTIDELPVKDAALLSKARAITRDAYAPYSNFHVAAAAYTIDGELVTGTNQENAAYSVGICAERSLLATAATLFPGKALTALAISYYNKEGISNTPISPCGMCRQALLEYEARVAYPVRIILGGQQGEVYIINTASALLPFAFSSNDL